MAQLQIGEGQPQMRHPIIGVQLQRFVEILHGLVGLLHIVLDIAAVDVSFHHLRVPLHRPGVVILGAVEQA